MARCCKRFCFRAGRWHPVLVLRAPAPFDDAPPVRALVGIVVCQAHKTAAVLADFLDESGWPDIVRAFHAVRAVAPDPARTDLDWAAITDAEAVAFRAAVRRRLEDQR